jgi:hypothetical protein
MAEPAHSRPVVALVLAAETQTALTMLRVFQSELEHGSSIPAGWTLVTAAVIARSDERLLRRTRNLGLGFLIQSAAMP